MDASSGIIIIDYLFFELFVYEKSYDSTFLNDLTFTNDVPYLLHKNFIIQIRDKATELGVEEYLDSLIDVVWRIGYDIFKKRVPYTELNVLDVEEYKNWREYLEIDLTKSPYYISYQSWRPSKDSGRLSEMKES